MISKPGSDDRQLILISGAVASGKTTLAWRLAELARERGVPSASIDIDELVEMIAGRDWSLVTNEHRRRACELAAILAQRLFDAGSKLVAIAGSTLSSSEWQEVLRHLGVRPRATHVLLRVSLTEAVRRARGDPTRVATRDPDVVARLHGDIDWASIRQPDIELDTDDLSSDEVAEAVALRVLTTM